LSTTKRGQKRAKDKLQIDDFYLRIHILTGRTGSRRLAIQAIDWSGVCHPPVDIDLDDTDDIPCRPYPTIGPLPWPPQVSIRVCKPPKECTEVKIKRLKERNQMMRAQLSQGMEKSGIYPFLCEHHPELVYKNQKKPKSGFVSEARVWRAYHDWSNCNLTDGQIAF
jgi:hypothetical protein